MADYWRLAEASDPRLSAFPGPVKRSRADFGGLLAQESYYGGLLAQESYFGERESRASDLLRNGMGLGPELGLGVTPGIGMGAMASGGYGSLGVPPARDDTRLVVPGLGKPGGLNGGDYVGRPVAPVLRPSLLPPDATSTLYVEGIPLECSRREVAHIFRPFIGFKEVRLVLKDPKRPSGEKFVLCFVQFSDPKNASVSMDALQGYKFDENNPDSPTLKLHFARGLGPRAGGRDDFHGGRN